MNPDMKVLRDLITNELKLTTDQRAHMLDCLRLVELQQEVEGLRRLIASRVG